MRRSLDAARAKLGTLEGRDEIIDCFFTYACVLFERTVLFVVRGDVAVGHNVRGLEVNRALVSKLSVPLQEPGILQRVRDTRRAIVGIPTLTDADEQIFGTLGRMMPTALVSPVVVRDRVVALFVGDLPAAQLRKASTEIGRSAMDLAKEEMLVWSESVSEALEQLIKRRRGGSVPPPGLSSLSPQKTPSVPPPGRVPSFHTSGTAGSGPSATPAPYVEPIRPLSRPPSPFEEAQAEAEAEAVRGRSRRGAIFAALLALAVIGGGAAAVRMLKRAEADPFRVVVTGNQIAGFPSSVDAIAALDAAKGASGLSNPELASIRAEVGPGGRIDVEVAPKNEAGISLAYQLVTADSEADVRVDRGGIRAPSVVGRRRCGDKPCVVAVPPPKCTFAQVWTAAVGARSDIARLFVSYGARADDEVGGPLFVVDAGDAGHVRVDSATCALLPRERLRPPALALAAVPGAPKPVDPLELVAVARKQAGLDDDAVLVEVDAQEPGASGRVDPAGGGAAVFTFSDPASVPVRTRRWRQVELRANGLSTTMDESRGQLPAQYDPSLPAPSCTFATAHAYVGLGRSGPPPAVHRISYGRDIGSHEGRWTIELGASGDSRIALTDADCSAWATANPSK